MKQINPKDIKLINKYFAKHLASAHLYDKLNYFDKVLLLLNEKKVYNLLSTTIFFYQKTQSSFQYLKNRK